MNQQYSLFKDKISQSSFLITGGAGFIGANLVELLLGLGAKKVRVLDNLSNGYYTNIEGFVGLPNFEFMEGDIRDLEICSKAVEGMIILAIKRLWARCRGQWKIR
jgi:UDP-N-acetylglucosamine 4-epimerase